MDNMKIYQAGRQVPAEACKSFSNGSFSGTDINPMWRIKTLTELFGPCGIGWYYEIISERAETHHDITMAIVDLNLYIKVDGEWSKPIYGTGGNKLVSMTKSGARASDEGYKMALTDALSVACKALGIGADVYFAADKTKYTEYEIKEEPAPADEVKAETEYKAPAFDARKAANIWAAEHKITIQQFAEIHKALAKEGAVRSTKIETKADFEESTTEMIKRGLV